jgi:exodeoxyribonuclease V alpha subunit
MQKSVIHEKIRGIVERITFHNMENGWSVLRVSPFGSHGEIVTVLVHQVSVFAGATMEFIGNWTHHKKYGRQFKADTVIEKKPASAGALEKYLGSGLIKGVGPKTAKKIVSSFGQETLDVFENHIERLKEVEGIAAKKLLSISNAWQEHRSIRNVMMFLQSHGISTLFAVRIYKRYGDNAIALVTENPYRLAMDFYGIGFFSADKIALSIGMLPESEVRITAAIRHILSASREQGHCYLTRDQINQQTAQLLDREISAGIDTYLSCMEEENLLKVRVLPDPNQDGNLLHCYYSKTLYFDEEFSARKLASIVRLRNVNLAANSSWMVRFQTETGIKLSDEQASAVLDIANQQCSVLTGGPGCGKTTTTKVLVALLHSLGASILLAAPTGRAAQRMTEVIGLEARTIHRLLEFQSGGFKRNENNPLQADFLIIDECSMLDISLTASLLRAVSDDTAILFIGDADQLPSVGAGNVLHDIIDSAIVPCFRLVKIFRQAEQSHIIQYAHAINQGKLPGIDSPFKKPEVWGKNDCFFIDADEATQEQLRFVARVKQHFASIEEREHQLSECSPYYFDAQKTENSYQKTFELPEKFGHVQLNTLLTADSTAEMVLAVQKKVHPWSSLYYGLTAVDVVRNLYMEWVPKYFGTSVEIQVLSPMIRGSLGTVNLNHVVQQAVNPSGKGKNELTVGEKIFRVGDRVIHRRNNYELNVFNGDIGCIQQIDNNALTCIVAFYPDMREVEYKRDEITELDLAYAITVHKSQGSEFDVVILPVLTQHYRMLFSNLIYTGLTRARKLAVFVGTRRALAMAVSNKDTAHRQTALYHLLKEYRIENTLSLKLKVL